MVTRLANLVDEASKYMASTTSSVKGMLGFARSAAFKSFKEMNSSLSVSTAQKATAMTSFGISKGFSAMNLFKPEYFWAGLTDEAAVSMEEGLFRPPAPPVEGRYILRDEGRGGGKGGKRGSYGDLLSSGWLKGGCV